MPIGCGSRKGLEGGRNDKYGSEHTQAPSRAAGRVEQKEAGTGTSRELGRELNLDWGER